jgi:hypothetical protein
VDLRSQLHKEEDQQLVATPFHETEDFKRMSTVNALVDIMSESFVAQSEDNDDYEKGFCKELEYILQFETQEDFAMLTALTAARRIITRFSIAQKKRIVNMAQITNPEQQFYDTLAPNPKAPKTPKTANEKFMRDELLRQRYLALDSLLRKEAGDLKNLLRMLFTNYYGFLIAVKKDMDETISQSLLETFPKTYLKLNRRLYNKIYSTTTNNRRVPCVLSLRRGDRDLNASEGTSLDEAQDQETAPRKRAINEESINMGNHAKKARETKSSATMADSLDEFF